MPKRKRPPEKPKDQFKRFLETAKEHEVEQSGKDAEKAFSSLARRAANRSPSRPEKT